MALQTRNCFQGSHPDHLHDEWGAVLTGLKTMRMRSPIPHKKARIEIIPLIDIMFFLLASFMMVSLSQTHMKGIRVNLPAAVGPPPEGKVDFVSVKVLEGNAVFFNNEYVPDDQVLPKLFGL